MQDPDRREDSPGETQDRELALARLRELREETMAAAWGAQSTHEERRQIIQAALIFGRKLEERLSQRSEELHPDEAQRFLMSLINDVISEFARQEDMDRDKATSFLSDVKTRDLVLEFNEVLESREQTGLSLDEQLQQIVDDRQERAIWSDHFRSG